MKNTEITCPHCGANEHMKKNGFYRGTQRYKCDKCGRTFTMSNLDKRIKYPLLLRKLALSLYLSGTSLRGIQRALNVSFSRKIYVGTILRWLKNADGLLEEENQRRKEEIPKTGEKTIIPIVEMDELFTFIKKNRETRKREDPISMGEYGLLWIDSQIKLLHLR
jgi:transposase-like protein